MSYLVGIVLGLVVQGILLLRQGADAGRWRIIALLSGMGVAAGFGAKLYSVIERGGFVWHDPAWELSSGYRYPGASIAVLLTLPILHCLLRPGVALARIFDVSALGACVAMVVIRIGCFQAGCCHGTVTDLAWATQYASGSAPWHAHVGAGLIPRSTELSAYAHPLQIYFLIAIVVIGAFLRTWQVSSPRVFAMAWDAMSRSSLTG